MFEPLGYLNLGGAVPAEVGITPMDTKGDPCEDVGCNGKGDE
jgi:hypothetical protein